jgi:hypothetical protein
MNDDELNELLSSWTPPEPPARLRRRIEALRPAPAAWWRRRVAIPAPLLAAACLILIAVLYWSNRGARVSSQPPASGFAGFQPVKQVSYRIYREGE